MADATRPSESAPASAWVQAAPPPPPPPAGTTYAGVGIRFVAWLLDLLPLLVLAVLLFGALFGDLFLSMTRALPERPGYETPDSPELRAAMGDALIRFTAGSLRAFAILQVGALLYYAGSWLWLGRSPAMALFGLHIVREEDAGRPDLGRVIVRYAGFVLSATPFLLGYAWALIDPRKQAWHDKLAGTLVVREAARIETPVAASWGGASEAEDQRVGLQAHETTPAEQGTDSAARPHDRGATLKRPSIGALAEWAWETFRRAPAGILAGIGPVLVPAFAVLFVALAVYLLAAQDQQVAVFRLMREGFATAADPAAFGEYNRRLLAASAPSVWIGGLLVAIAALAGTLLMAACSVVLGDQGETRRPREVARVLGQRLPALLVLGTAAALGFAGEMLVLGLPSLALAEGSPVPLEPGAAAAALGRFGALLGLTWLVIVPASLYLGAIWLLAIVAVATEGLGVRAALARAWALSRGNMLWLMGTLIVVGLAASWVVGALVTLPMGLLSDAYLAGARLPVVLQVLILVPIALLTVPVNALVYVGAYRALRAQVA